MIVSKTTGSIALFRHEQNNLPETKSATNFYPQLNGLRFLFVLMVLLHHWGPETIFKNIRIGWLGVDLFFVLSGFLIGEILLLEKAKTKDKVKSIRNFIIRRALRIFPLYYITIIVYSVLVTSGGIFIWNITYTNNILQLIDFSRVGPQFWHLWSLCVEEQFYLFFPFLLFFVRKKTFLIFLITGIIFSALGRFGLIIFDHNSLAYSLMPFCLDSLFMGALLAYLKTYNIHLLKKIFSKKIIISLAIILLTTGLAWVSINDNMASVFSLYRFLGSLLGFVVIGYSVIFGYGGVLKKFLEYGAIALLGKISYGIYLLHPFVEEFYRSFADQNFVKNYLLTLHLPVVSNMYIIDFVSLFSATIFISYLSFQFIEKRFLKLKHLFSQ